MIIDFHTHCFPAAIASRALVPMQELTGIVPCTDGTVEGSVKKIKEDGVDFAVVCNIATNAHQLAKVNSFAIDINDFSRSLIALGTAHPESPILEDELQRLVDHDIRGIKIHPEYMPYYIDDSKWDTVFSLCEEMGIFVMTHAGLDPTSPDRIAATPDRIAKVLDKHKSLTFIAAHLGGVRCQDEVKSHLCGRDNLYFDTAYTTNIENSREYAPDIIRLHGADKILFGSDMPWSEPKREIAFVRSLGLSSDEEDKIFFKNAQKLLF